MTRLVKFPLILGVVLLASAAWGAARSAPDLGAYEKKQYIFDGDEMLPKKCKSTNAACYVQP